MKFKQLTVLLGVLLILTVGSVAFVHADEDVNLKETYGVILDELIAKCKYKTQMRYSKSDVIRKAAMLSCLKTTFYKENKDALIEAMINDEIGVKRYKMAYYLNTQFYNLVRPHKQVVAKSYWSH